ncbi:MAG: O-antigen ligase family protein [Gammaproteobacteria bacterium]|nr:O-antigen ligase family protein [Gammaproteobacteria bacterium]
MEAKQLIFLGLTAVFIPSAVLLGITFRWAERALVAGTFLSTAFLIDINLLSTELYRGDTRGFEFGLTDWMVSSLILVMLFSPRWRHRKLDLFPPNSTLILAYFGLAVVSTVVAYVPVYSGFGLFKLVRAFAVYWVAYNYLREEGDLRFILYILAGIVIMEFMFVLQQKLGGTYRARGTTPHSNTLGVYINMITMLFFAFLLGDRRPKLVPLYLACVGFGALMVIATFSRGALVSMVFGFMLVVALSFYDRISQRKVQIIAVVALLALPLAIKVMPAVIERFLEAPEASGESRGYANAAALAMANVHFFGVGLNNYSHVINETNYVRFIDDPVDRGIVHNVYLLHASEMGWFGLIIFLVMIGNFFRIGIKVVRRRRNNTVSMMAIGILAAMFVLWFQSLLEWFFRQTYVTVEFFMLAGILTALPRIDDKMRANLKKSQRLGTTKMLLLLQFLSKRKRAPA